MTDAVYRENSELLAKHIRLLLNTKPNNLTQQMARIKLGYSRKWLLKAMEQFEGVNVS
jgi:hypothetical protein